jgi:hypothetical protein
MLGMFLNVVGWIDVSDFRWRELHREEQKQILRAAYPTGGAPSLRRSG